MEIKEDYTREELISLCELAIVPETKWDDRDCSSAHITIGTAWALLKAGCPFEVKTKNNAVSNDCITDDETIWIEIQHADFGTFESLEWPEDDDGKPGKRYGLHSTYIPTWKRLAEAKGGDWY